MILIDIEMPKECGSCPCCTDVFTSDGEQETQWCRLLGRSTDEYASPYDDCPLKIQPETKHRVPIQSLIDHIKTATDVDPWAKEMAEDLLKKV